MAFGAGIGPVAPPENWKPGLGLGCAPIGGLYTGVTEEAAAATVSTALGHGVRFFDTAPHYGAGLSEHRLGQSIAEVDRDSIVVATKVGRQVVDPAGQVVSPGAVGADTVKDLSHDGVHRSVESSLARLGTDRVDLLYLHDPDDVDEAIRGAIPALIGLREEGVVRAIGVGMVRNEPLCRFITETPIDVVMIAGRATLLDRSAEVRLLPEAGAHGVQVVAAGVFNSGILADPTGSPYFDYHQAEPEVVQRAREFQDLCRRAGVELADAAVQFPRRYESVSTIVVGARSAHEVDSFVDGMRRPIPESLWSALEAL